MTAQYNHFTVLNPIDVRNYANTQPTVSVNFVDRSVDVQKPWVIPILVTNAQGLSKIPMDITEILPHAPNQYATRDETREWVKKAKDHLRKMGDQYVGVLTSHNRSMLDSDITVTCSVFRVIVNAGLLLGPCTLTYTVTTDKIVCTPKRFFAEKEILITKMIAPY